MQKMVSSHNAILLVNERNTFKNQSFIDELTSLNNRRNFMQNLERYLNKPRYSDDAFCLAVADIDYFKGFNDFYGHSQGDECLRAIGKVLGDIGQKHGIYAARIGGEEFALLWFEDELSCNSVLEAVRESVLALKIPHEKSSVSPFVTLSIGAYILHCNTENDFSAVYERADEALYTAKRNGRNRTVVHDGRVDMSG
jgi:diguanylate cyclase (GGDEF)-like protein